MYSQREGWGQCSDVSCRYCTVHPLDRRSRLTDTMVKYNQLCTGQIGTSTEYPASSARSVAEHADDAESGAQCLTSLVPAQRHCRAHPPIDFISLTISYFSRQLWWRSLFLRF